ncbi:hypothetical protein CFC21_074900 [Triticum aestivum]|uniref:Protein kinase domain-containing protein n=2 Tax=Triticum aestivum TaxID=4565 RepID=A0A3B6LXY9_WHEAT|nr:putative receptor-like protein kinase At4g00960 [Triticum aestivum]KAF7069241.1 hypothetical protein CFC21_074900 [Triticum aestivum]
MERRRLSQEDELLSERRRSPEEDAVEDRVTRELAEAEEKRKREKEEDDLEEFQLQLILEMSNREMVANQTDPFEEPRSKEHSSVDWAIIRESCEVEERKREREKEEEELEKYQLELVLEMSQREMEIEVANQICQEQKDLSEEPCSKESYEDGESSSQTSESISTLLSSFEISDQAIELKTLEDILIDANAKPARLSYTFIRSITGNFSQEIGRGGFGVVYLGHVGTWKVAVKKLSILQGFSDKPFVDEINCLMGIRHNNIVRFLGYCADTHGEFVPFNGSHVMAEVPQRMLCFEYVPNGNLQKYLKDKSHKDEWKTQYQMIRGICHGLDYLHNKRITHLDLKPDNIILDACLEPKITDFGLSRCFDEGISRVYTKIIRGTPGSIAPEIIDSGEITFKSDVYDLGIIIMKILTGRNNFDFENWDTSIDVDDPQVQSCIGIAKKCVPFNQHERPTIGEIMQKLDEIERMGFEKPTP